MIKHYFELMKHKMLVAKYLSIVAIKLLKRAILHDISKFSKEEAQIFAKYTPLLKKSTYGSDEYSGFLKKLKHALSSHYRNNRHHPEYFLGGFDSMNLIDRIEMLCDWYAATKRHEDGNVIRSIKLNKERFGYNSTDAEVLAKTLSYCFGVQLDVCPKCHQIESINEHLDHCELKHSKESIQDES